MDLTGLKQWKDILHTHNRPALEHLLQEKKWVLALLDHVSRKDFSEYRRDEKNFLRLLSVIAQHAHWIDGELVIIICCHRQIGFCVVFVMNAKGSIKELIKKIDFPSSFLAFWKLVDNTPFLMAPLQVSRETTQRELVLKAPRVQRRLSVTVSNLTKQKFAPEFIKRHEEPILPAAPQRNILNRPPALELNLDNFTSPDIRGGTEEEETIDSNWD